MANTVATDLSVMVVSGHAATRLNIKRFLERRKHTVHVATSGREMIKMDKNFLGNLLIVDNMLPDMPVEEMLFTMRENRRLMKDIANIDYVPVVLIAGANEVIDDKKLAGLGVIARLTKPLNLKKMGEFLELVNSGEINVQSEKHCNIGILDPEIRAQQYMSKLLEAEDVKVSRLGDVFDLRASLGHGELDILIIEIMVVKDEPDIFFTELLGINPKLKIVVCTAYMDDDEQEKIHEVGVSDIMTKPIDPMKIRKRVRELVGEWEQG